MKPRILVVEDNADNLETLTAYLEYAKYTTLKASDGEEALEIVAKEKPDVIFLDLSLPKMDGWQVAKNIRATPDTSHIIIIAFSAMALAQEKEKAIACGCDAFMAKPMPPEMLIDEMNKIIKQRNG